MSRLHSEPNLGSWCFRIETDQGPLRVNCPCAFDTTLKPVDAIFFTHKDFLRASRRYREH
ncbi:MAG: hypothetical protein OXN97_24400 [Bryobacterales bacterium]|nr:hypothetical protein [Bryobacterales bacterium]